MIADCNQQIAITSLQSTICNEYRPGTREYVESAFRPSLRELTTELRRAKPMPEARRLAGGGSWGYLESSADRSTAAASMCKVLSFVPSGTRNGKVQENSGTEPTSTNCDGVK